MKDKNESELSQTSDQEIKPATERTYDISEEEKKFQSAIADMKNVQGHITKQAGGKYTIEYPELTEKQRELNEYLKSQADTKLKEIDDAMRKFDGEEAKESGFLGWIRYWIYSAEFMSFLFATVMFSYLFVGFRYSLDRFYLENEVQMLDEKYQSRISKLEEELIQLNRANYVHGVGGLVKE